MREGYIKQDLRKKILLLGDDLRHPSGIGTMCKEIVLGTAHRFNWVQIAGAINHPEAGKVIDLSESITEETGVEDPYVRLYPNNGYGDMQVVRQVIAMENPDAIFIFTDPRYWVWLFNAEREIRTKMPIIYLNIWDDLPYPMWNKPFYESCDGLLAISKQTYNINVQVLGDKIEEHIVRYVPHGVSSKYFPMPKDDPKIQEFKNQVFKDKEFDFVLLYNARNLGRKRPGDIILGWRHFCDMIGKEKAKKCCLLMHTDPVDNAGTDLPAICRALCDPEYVNILFLPNRFSTEMMNVMYNACDGVILISSNEGWGLSLTEALNTGKMIIATVTGGMQDQMRFQDEDGNWISFSKTFPSNHTGMYKEHGIWAIPIFPVSRALCGSVPTPYIYDDRVGLEDISNAILELYEKGPEEREKCGMEGYEWATGEEAGFTSEAMCARIIEGIEATFENFEKHPRSRYEFIKVPDERPSERVDYDPVTYSI